MYESILRQIQQHIRAGNYVLSDHAQEEMDEDWLLITNDDIEAAIMAGVVVERQTDWRTGEFKYVIEGYTVVGNLLGVVCKLINGVVIITVYLIK